MPVAKTTFILNGIDIDDIARRYEFPVQNDQQEDIVIPTNATEINVDPVIYYHDAVRRQKTGLITMVDYLGKRLPDHTDIYCFWCRHPFDTPPLGVPVKYIPSEAIKRYKSDTITRLTVETITEERRRKLRNENGVMTLFSQDPDKFSYSTLVVENGHYLTDAIVCSYECMAAWINDNSHDPLYYQSKMYMKRIVRDSIGDIKITPAGSYRLLKPYGGSLDIIEFRDGFTTITYQDLCNPLFEHPEQKSIGWLHNCEVRF